MAHTYTLNLVHCVFSTKGRLPLMTDPPKAWDLIRRVGGNANLHIHAIGAHQTTSTC
jgi:hypothetical protein